jgi:hypothetical protein
MFDKFIIKDLTIILSSGERLLKIILVYMLRKEIEQRNNIIEGAP